MAFIKAFKQIDLANEQRPILSIPQYIDFALYEQALLTDTNIDSKMNKAHQLSSNVLEHSCLPYQHIINLQDQQNYQVLPSTLFQYESLVSSVTAKNNHEVGSIEENSVPIIYFDRDRSHDNGIAAFDLTFTISHDYHARTTECFLDCSIHIFTSQTNVHLLANRFQHMLKQLFSSSSLVIHEPIYRLAIVLPAEQEFIHQINNTNISTSYSWPNSVHECFIQQAQLYPQKLAIELDEQSLTYSK
ncbi:unnamed protein product, partial [Adineta steineri]